MYPSPTIFEMAQTWVDFNMNLFKTASFSIAVFFLLIVVFSVYRRTRQLDHQTTLETVRTRIQNARYRSNR